jgi:hypothetical protein
VTFIDIWHHWEPSIIVAKCNIKGGHIYARGFEEQLLFEKYKSMSLALFQPMNLDQIPGPTCLHKFSYHLCLLGE